MKGFAHLDQSPRLGIFGHSERYGSGKGDSLNSAVRLENSEEEIRRLPALQADPLNGYANLDDTVASGINSGDRAAPNYPDLRGVRAESDDKSRLIQPEQPKLYGEFVSLLPVWLRHVKAKEQVVCAKPKREGSNGAPLRHFFTTVFMGQSISAAS